MMKNNNNIREYLKAFGIPLLVLVLLSLAGNWLHYHIVITVLYFVLACVYGGTLIFAARKLNSFLPVLIIGILLQAACLLLVFT